MMGVFDGEYWYPLSNDSIIKLYFRYVERPPAKGWANAIMHMAPDWNHDYGVGFYDLQFVCEDKPTKWRGRFFTVPGELDKAFDALVELSMTHNLVGVNRTRCDLYFERSNDHQTNIDSEIVGSFLEWKKNQDSLEL